MREVLLLFVQPPETSGSSKQQSQYYSRHGKTQNSSLEPELETTV